MVNGLHFSFFLFFYAFLTISQSKHLLPNIHSSGAVRVNCLAQGHLYAQLGGAGDQTSNFLFTSRTALPPEPHAAHIEPFPNQRPFKVGLSARAFGLYGYSGKRLNGSFQPEPLVIKCNGTTFTCTTGLPSRT